MLGSHLLTRDQHVDRVARFRIRTIKKELDSRNAPMDESGALPTLCPSSEGLAEELQHLLRLLVGEGQG